jgi:hypothetical protein
VRKVGEREINGNKQGTSEAKKEEKKGELKNWSIKFVDSEMGFHIF